jgi:hypothetical protein
MSIEKFNDLIGTQTHDLPAYSIVTQPTTLPRASLKRRQISLLTGPLLASQEVLFWMDSVFLNYRNARKVGCGICTSILPNEIQRQFTTEMLLWNCFKHAISV